MSKHWLNRGKNPAKDGLEAEREAAKEFGAKRSIASGQFWFSKGDYQTDKFLCEHKSTKSMQYTIRLGEWMRLRMAALSEELDPMMIVEFYDEGGNLRKRLVIIDAD